MAVFFDRNDVNMDDDVLEQSLQMLRHHYHPEWGDRSLMDVFNRLLSKNIRQPGWKRTDHMDVRIGQIRSFRDQRSTAELTQFPRTHDRDKPIKEDCPIIVVVYAGQDRLLDGTTRINYWVNTGNSDLHDLNVHVIE